MTLSNLNIGLDLIKTTESALMNYSTIADGTLYFTTDTKNIYADLGGARHCFSSIWFRNSLSELMTLPKIASVLYWDTSEDIGYRYINNTLTKVISSRSVGSLSLQKVASIESVTEPSEDIVYAVATNDPYGENAYDLYVHIDGVWVQVTPGKSDIEVIATEKIDETLDAVEIELAAIRDSLKADTLDSSEYYDNIEDFYKNVYTKQQTYTSEEVDDLIVTNVGDLQVKISTTQPCVSKMSTSKAGVIKLENNVSMYTHDIASGNVISIDTSELMALSGDMISFELLLVGADATTPSYNFNLVAWVDEVEPTYYNHTVVGFRSFDNGTSWVGYYGGGWNQ